MKNAIKIKRYKLPENICQIFSRADGFQRTLPAQIGKAKNPEEAKRALRDISSTMKDCRALRDFFHEQAVAWENTMMWFTTKQKDLIAKIEEGAFPNEPNRK